MNPYNYEREQLTRQHSNALRQLGTLYTRSVNGLYLSLASQGPSGLIAAFTSQLSGMTYPFQLSAAQVALQFHTMRREQAASNATGRVPPSNVTLDRVNIPSLANTLMGGKLADIGFMLSKGLGEGRAPEELAPAIVQASSKLVTEADRETAKIVADEDNYSDGWAVAVSPDGCSYCKSLTIEWGVDGGVHFHDNCNCVVDANFKDEIKFRQSFHDDYMKDVEEARELIESGEAGERTLQAGSEEWARQIKKELANDSRAWRKDFEKKRGLSQEQRGVHRKRTGEMSDSIASKASLVAQGKASWNAKELDVMKGWGVDSENLTKPRSVPVNTFTQKNLNVAMDIVQNNRTIKQ